jgi:copper chaperone CopZ
MSDRKLAVSKRLAAAIMVAATAVILIIVFGYNAFSNKGPGQLTLTEYRKDGSPPEAVVKREVVPGSTDKASFLKIDGDVSKAVLNVKGLACSSCIQEIKAALSTINGIKDILVDITRGTAQVYYNGKELGDAGRLAQAITSRGYPATLAKVYSAEEVRKETELAAARVQFYIASVGGWDIARSDFEAELEFAKRRYAKLYGEQVLSSARGKALVDRLRAQIASRLIDEGVMMQEIARAGFKVDPAMVENELQRAAQKSGKGLEGFKAALQENGIGLDYFKKKVETELLINTYLDEKVFADASNEVDKRALFTSWFNNAKILAEVLYYDKDLELLVQQQSAQGKCGG